MAEARLSSVLMANRRNDVFVELNLLSLSNVEHHYSDQYAQAVHRLLETKEEFHV